MQVLRNTKDRDTAQTFILFALSSIAKQKNAIVSIE